jgi:hypothetical protein
MVLIGLSKMNSPVDFHDKAGLPAQEIHDERPDDMLPPKTVGVHSAIAQPLP